MTQRILFITLSNIGDAILTTPTLAALHQAYPSAVVDIVADARSDILFRHCPYRGELFLKRKREGWRGLLRLLHKLRHTRYDLAVDLRTDGLLWLIRADRRIGKLANRPSLGLHSAEKHFRAVAPLTGGNVPPTCLWLSDAERKQASGLLGSQYGKRLLALGPGANWPPKIWPEAHFAELANRLIGHFDAVLLLGSAQDQPRAEKVAATLRTPVLDLCGKTDLLLAAALLEQATCFVGNDSGLGHLASAVGTPTLTIFGPGEPRRYHPWGKHSLWLQSQSRAIEEVTPQQAHEAVLSLLEKAPPCA